MVFIWLVEFYSVMYAGESFVCFAGLTSCFVAAMVGVIFVDACMRGLLVKRALYVKGV